MRLKSLPILVVCMLIACLGNIATFAESQNLTDPKSITIPQMINYQGHLLDNYGVPQSGNFNMTFKIYDALTGGTIYWVETQVVPVTNGLFNVTLGKTNPITTYPTGSDWYLEMVVASELVSPRQRILSNGYSYMSLEAENANKLGGVAASSYATKPIQNTDINDNAVTSAKIANGTIIAEDIANGTITSDKIASIADTKLVGSGTLIGNLNADKLDGSDASAFLSASTDYGRLNVSATLYEGSTALSSKYLGISAKAADSDLLDGYHYNNLPVASHNHMGDSWNGGSSALEISGNTPDWVVRSYNSGSGAAFVAVGNGAIASGRGALESIDVNSAGVGIVGQGQGLGGWHYAVGGAGGQLNGTTCGLWATGENSSGTTYGVNGRVYSTSGWGVYGFCNNNSNWGGLGGSYGVYYAGGLAGTGSKSCVVRTSSGPRKLYCQESPENWFEDFGEAHLVNGRVHIALDSEYLETVTINSAHPMKVFVQQTSGDQPLSFIVKRGQTGFDIIGPDGVEVDVSYRIVAKRKGFESERLTLEPLGYSDSLLYPDSNDPAIPESIREMRRLNSESDTAIKQSSELVGATK